MTKPRKPRAAYIGQPKRDQERLFAQPVGVASFFMQRNHREPRRADSIVVYPGEARALAARLIAWADWRDAKESEGK